MQINFSKLTLRDGIVFCFLSVISVQYGLQCTDYEITGGKAFLFLFFYIFALLFFLVLCDYSYKDLFFIFLFLSLCLVVTRKSGFPGFAVMLIASIMLSRWEWDRIFKVILFLRGIIFVTIIGLSLCGVLDLYKTLVVKGGYSAIGYGLGFTHPNRMAYGFTYLIILYVCLLGKRIAVKDYLIIILSSVICYCIAKSRTQVICTCGILFFSLFVNSKYFKSFFESLVYIIGLLIVPFCFFFSIAVPYIMISGNAVLRNYAFMLDHMFSGRFLLTSRAFKYYKLPLFGGINNFDILDSVHHFSTVDNGYIRFIYSYGLIGMIIYVLLTVLTVYFLKKRKEMLYVSMIIVVSFWAISENILITVGFNVIVIFWSVIMKDFKKFKFKNKSYFHRGVDCGS